MTLHAHAKGMWSKLPPDEQRAYQERQRKALQQYKLAAYTPTPPKRPANAYCLFLAEKHEAIVAKLRNEGTPPQKILPLATKEVAGMWKALPEETRATYKDKKTKLEDYWEFAMDDFYDDHPEQAAPPQAPTKPSDAFGQFLNEKRAYFTKKLAADGDKKKKGWGIKKEAKKAWTSMKDDEKKIYETRADDLLQKWTTDVSAFQKEHSGSSASSNIHSM